MRINSTLYIKLFAKKVGEDEFGNKYYLGKHKNADGKPKRLVKYNNLNDDPSKIPPMWHMWLHYVINELPIKGSKKYFWQKSQTGNKTGTKDAYFPKGHPSLRDKIVKIDNYYESWDPNKK